MNTRSHRVPLALSVGLLLLLAPAGHAGAVASRTAAARVPLAVAPTQALAVMLTSQQALSAPDAHSARVALVALLRPITDAPTVLPVIGHATGPAGAAWLHVRLPGRPNDHTGWVRQSATVFANTRWHVVIDISERRLTVYRDGRVVRVLPAIVGKPSTPTPVGTAFVEEIVQVPPGGSGAPYALALSSRSTVYQEFAGGPGQIAIHGIANIGGALGTAVSHGCIRLATEAIVWLAERVGPGAPVTVTP